MASPNKRLLLLPVLIAFYLANPLLGIVGLVGGYVSVFFVRRGRQGLISAAH